jgi:hypothetical protein
MGIFSSIMDKIFHHNQQNTTVATSAQQGQPAQPGTQAGTGQQSQSPGATQSSMATGGAAPAQRMQSVDVDAVLTKVASTKGGGGNWRTSIVDLLKLLDLDSSLNARKELANELNVHAGADGSAEQNMALQRAVMAKLAENGGKVPDSLRH